MELNCDFLLKFEDRQLTRAINERKDPNSITMRLSTTLPCGKEICVEDELDRENDIELFDINKDLLIRYLEQVFEQKVVHIAHTKEWPSSSATSMQAMLFRSRGYDEPLRTRKTPNHGTPPNPLHVGADGNTDGRFKARHFRTFKRRKKKTGSTLRAFVLLNKTNLFPFLNQSKGIFR